MELRNALGLCGSASITSHRIYLLLINIADNVTLIRTLRFRTKLVNVSNINTFAASYLSTQGLNNSCLKSPASTLVDLTFQSRALSSFSLNQLRNLSL